MFFVKGVKVCKEYLFWLFGLEVWISGYRVGYGVGDINLEVICVYKNLIECFFEWERD